MSIRFFSGGQSTNRIDPEPATSRSSATSSRWLIGLVAADVEDFAVARVGRARAQERVGGIVHVDEVAQLRAVAEDLDLADPRSPAG